MRRTSFAAFILALTLGACADATTSGGAATVTPSAGTDELVLRVATGGGFTPIGYQLRLVPEFSLYGDGMLITPGAQIEIYPGPALPALMTQHLSEDGVRSVLQAATDAGLSEGRDMTDLGNIGIADAATTTFTISVNGVTHSFDVYALFEIDVRPDQMPPDEFEARQELAAFVSSLWDLQGWLPAGAVGQFEGYRAERARVYVGPAPRIADLPQDTIDWPLTTSLGVAEGNAAGVACLVVSGADWSALAPIAATANELTPWISDGERFGLVFRPMLPDEHGC